MKFKQPQTLEQIATLLNVKFVGKNSFPITGINEIHVVEKGDIVFVDHPKYYDKALNSAATTILINKKVDCPEGKSLLISEDPFRDFNKITKYFNPFIASKSSIAESAIIGEKTVIQPNVFIGENVKIGKNCLIHANVSINNNCIIGDNVTIHANTVLGADAFYYKNRPEGFDKLISGGRVVLEDNVDLGASCTIDRGVTGDTLIGAGSKIDNQVHIGHDTVIGKKCLIAAQTGIAGCTVIEDEVTIWGQVGIVSGLTIEKGTVLMAQTGVMKSLKKGVYFGTPQKEYRQKMREVIYLKNETNKQKK
ncbi:MULTISPECIES: UDP-3-O-(3-hydroxymyristoyl)glucosamine N-acyltransferase [Tenacibaculum]|uniref:UDP-3-O-(3-hydroxymyristoyl)glucosamine N-acyltransferase n=1 Tax=Tenacibaculum mesophilum TaxID=104268 RepID=A0AAE9MLF4_9FLAO|nr:UDP-3-O-(3-hydroxymyristoyl)glucosamine N-acyltransferase [Tenacibaculum mesophilum]GFD92953.1 UDP-3-O-(3-hydroxymyristoyl)glucosamine N-acyltransferase [Alteromonas sp. KUL154]GFD99152.1 UDP-3-O-(3-hydroxymyristoyl)glucosamine N-acyltransferase [Alteromonas sp. KUL156]AZJ31640.1 UDP-3-O-(3-hydroxymyristoyl)glucosamine N-acyltransferase [Tenacibaculum mesophilum]KAF9657736.1 UDP-3-O-(3-hydroxymyristoyl)glucosamine N-acyltransferase [Tenacibaculum mesophilum]QFS26891.1 UDP-3-O-(3-hydroxymyri